MIKRVTIKWDNTKTTTDDNETILFFFNQIFSPIGAREGQIVADYHLYSLKYLFFDLEENELFLEVIWK